LVHGVPSFLDYVRNWAKEEYTPIEDSLPPRSGFVQQFIQAESASQIGLIQALGQQMMFDWLDEVLDYQG
jgi:hypothetical protein